VMLAPVTIVPILWPSLSPGGRKAYSIRGQLFDGKVGDRFLVRRSTTPFCDAPSVLLTEGVKPDTVFVMRHANSAADALRSTVGVAAELTVSDDGGAKPICQRLETVRCLLRCGGAGALGARRCTAACVGGDPMSVHITSEITITRQRQNLQRLHGRPCFSDAES